MDEEDPTSVELPPLDEEVLPTPSVEEKSVDEELPPLADEVLKEEETEETQQIPVEIWQTIETKFADWEEFLKTYSNEEIDLPEPIDIDAPELTPAQLLEILHEEEEMLERTQKHMKIIRQLSLTANDKVNDILQTIIYCKQFGDQEKKSLKEKLDTKTQAVEELLKENEELDSQLLQRQREVDFYKTSLKKISKISSPVVFNRD